MNTTKVSVLPIDIECGRRFLSSGCPVALALKRSFPDVKVHVGTLAAVVGERDIKLPNLASKFVSDFDCGNSVEPFEFYISF